MPVAGIAGDQQAALYGQACLDPGQGKSTYGTGSFVLLNSGAAPPIAPPGLLATVAWGIGARTQYALEASIFVTGAAVQWLRDGLGIIREAAETEALAASLESNDGVYFVPALTGLGSPHWDPYARGTIVGLTRGSGRAHLARATLEAIAYQSLDAIRAMEQASGRELHELKADGGATANGWLMQFQADVLGVPVVVPEVRETTALGAALLAGVGAGLWTQDRVGELWRERARWEPKMGGDERDALVGRWREAVALARAWAGWVASCRVRAGARARAAGQHEGAGLQGPAPRGALRALPRALADARARLGLRDRARAHVAVLVVVLPRPRHRGREGAAQRAGHPRAEPLLVHGPLLPRRVTRRKVRFMAKSQLFQRPMQWVYTHGGVFPVRRGFRDEEAFTTAHSVLERGGTVAMYCEGGRSRTGKLSERARPGIGRLALESGATVVPVAIHGSSRVRNWKKLQFPKVTIRYGEPFRFERVAEPTREQQQGAADEVFTAIKGLYAELEAHGRAGVVARVRAERRAARQAKRAATA